MRRLIWLLGVILLGGVVFVGGSASRAAQPQAAQPAAGPVFHQPGGLLTSTPTATPNPCGLAWRIVPSANSGTSTNALAAVAVAGPDDVWAAGYYNDTQAQADKTLIEHWTGTSWSIVPSANMGSNSNTLAGLAVVNAGDIWAVGSYFNNGNGHLQTLTEHWDGSNWTVVPSPNVANTDTLLNSVTAISSTDVWAVGGAFLALEGQAPNASQTVIMHWDGANWTLVPSPNPTGDSITLTGVSAAASNAVFAVGYYLDTSIFQFKTLALRWDGASWTIAPTQDDGANDSYLNGVSMLSSTLGWAVGYSHDGKINQNSTLIERWDGSAWTIVPSPLAGLATGNMLNGVAAISASDVWAVGSGNDGAATTTLTEHWNGSAWTIVPSPSNGPDFDTLQSVAAVASTDVWAVGYYDVGDFIDATLTERYHDPCVTPSPTATDTVLPSSTPTHTATALPSSTPTYTATPLPSSTPTRTATPLPASTATSTPTGTFVPPTSTATSIVPSSTSVPSDTPTAGPPSATPAATETPCPLSFGDVPSGYWAYDYIQWVYCHGIVSGYADGTFRPENDTIRGQIAKMVVLGAGLPLVVPPGAPHFSDVPPGSAFYLYVETGYGHDIISGYADGTFRPYAYVTRAQLAKMIVVARGLAIVTPAVPDFDDLSPDYWAYGYIETAFAHHIVGGYECGSPPEPCPGRYYRPERYATRAQLSKMIYLAFGVPTQ